MKFIISILALLLTFSFAHAQSLGMQQLGSLGGEIGSANGPVLVHALGAVASTVIENSTLRLDQGMFLACDITCDSVKSTGLNGLLYEQPLIAAFPNPADKFIELQGDPRLIFRYELYTLTGQQVAGNSISNARISLADQVPGVYTLHVYGQDGTLSLLSKVVKR